MNFDSYKLGKFEMLESYLIEISQSIGRTSSEERRLNQVDSLYLMLWMKGEEIPEVAEERVLGYLTVEQKNYLVEQFGCPSRILDLEIPKGQHKELIPVECVKGVKDKLLSSNEIASERGVVLAKIFDKFNTSTKEEAEALMWNHILAANGDKYLSQTTMLRSDGKMSWLALAVLLGSPEFGKKVLNHMDWSSKDKAEAIITLVNFKDNGCPVCFKAGKIVHWLKEFGVGNEVMWAKIDARESWYWNFHGYSGLEMDGLMTKAFDAFFSNEKANMDEFIKDLEIGAGMQGATWVRPAEALIYTLMDRFGQVGYENDSRDFVRDETMHELELMLEKVDWAEYGRNSKNKNLAISMAQFFGETKGSSQNKNLSHDGRGVLGIGIYEEAVRLMEADWFNIWVERVLSRCSQGDRRNHFNELIHLKPILDELGLEVRERNLKIFADKITKNFIDELNKKQTFEYEFEMKKKNGKTTSELMKLYGYEEWSKTVGEKIQEISFSEKKDKESVARINEEFELLKGWGQEVVNVAKELGPRKRF